jgi:hypothetical protein
MDRLSSTMKPAGERMEQADRDQIWEWSPRALPLPLLRTTFANEARPQTDDPPSDEEGLNRSQSESSSLATKRGVDEGEKGYMNGLRGRNQKRPLEKGHVKGYRRCRHGEGEQEKEQGRVLEAIRT